MENFEPVIGIDLGTTFSAVAYINEHDKPEVIPNKEGNLTTPSVVHFYDKDSFIVGDEAVNMRFSEPGNTVSFIKRMMGDTDYKVDIYGKEYNPQEISALILRKLKKDAETFFKNKGYDGVVRHAVITVPSYFSMQQRGATKEAGELAGLNVLSLINEPTAAAYAYGLHQLARGQRVLIFDLGYLAFDVTVMEIVGHSIEPKATYSDPELGGKDWDDTLLDHCTELFKAKHGGSDPQDDIFSYQELYDRVIKAKISLSQRPKTKIQVSHEGARENIDMSRETFEEISEDLLAQCQSMSEKVLERANTTWHEIDAILLTGGASNMPMIKKMLKKASGLRPVTKRSPELCVAIGAAYAAYFTAHGWKHCDCEACERFYKKTDSPMPISKVSIFTNKDLQDIKYFLYTARRIDKYKTCKNLYDLFDINNKREPFTDEEIKNHVKKIDAFFKSIYPGGKYKDLYRIMGKFRKLSKVALNEGRNEYDEYLKKDVINILEDYFVLFTKYDNILDSNERESLIKEGVAKGLTNLEINNLIKEWLMKYGAKEIENEATFSSSSGESFSFYFDKTYYKILGIPEDADASQIKQAFNREHKVFIMATGKKKAEARTKFTMVSEAYKYLKDPIKRKEYDSRLKELSGNLKNSQGEH